MKIALVHDYFVRYGGAERVIQFIHQRYPNATIFSLVAKKSILSQYFPQAQVKVLCRFGAVFPQLWYRTCVQRFTRVIERLDLSPFDVVISSGGYSKGIITRVRTKHVAYIHAPTRFLWDWYPAWIQEQKFSIPGATIASHVAIHKLRMWDFASAQRPDVLLANSSYTQQRIKKYYRRNAEILFPPINTTDVIHKRRFHIAVSTFHPDREYFLIVSRMVPYKGIELALETIRILGYSAIVVGDGPLRFHLEQKYNKRHIKFVGSRNHDQVRELMDYAYALIFPGEDDFGLVIAEAISQGTGVIAYGNGGSLDIIKHGVNGVLFENQSTTSLAVAIQEFIARRIASFPDRIRETSSKFRVQEFYKRLDDIIFEQ